MSGKYFEYIILKRIEIIKVFKNLKKIKIMYSK